jgi:tetratricopeptide (TPR) repeat protein
LPGQPPPERKPRWLRRLLILAAILILVLPAIAVFGPPEIAAWHLASAQEERAAGNKDRAYDLLQNAVRWSPRSAGILLQRAIWRLEDGQADAALTDANAAAELRADEYQILSIRAQILQHLDRHAEAIADWKAIDRLSQTRGTPDRATGLNGLAYARAVGKLDLKEATRNVEEALQLAPGNPAILDTRGYLLYLQGEHAKALTDMDLAVKGFESQSPGPARESPRAIDMSGLNTHEQGVAVVRYHRALVLKALGREADAEQDLRRVRELIGREPDEKLF